MPKFTIAATSLAKHLALSLGLAMTYQLTMAQATGPKPKTTPKTTKTSQVAKKTVALPKPIAVEPVAPPLPQVVTFETDLAAITNDQLLITCTPPKFSQAEVVYRLPAMVPGTYKVYNFGRYVSGFEAMDAKGNQLPVTHGDQDSWRIGSADKLVKIRYRVSDSFDTLTKNNPFEPAGSNIQVDTTVLLQSHCFFGYFDGFKNTPIKVHVQHKENMYGATSLVDANPSLSADLFEVPNYVVLADSPILYKANADTASVTLGETKVQIAVHDEKGAIHAKDLLPELQGMLQAASDFFGGKLPAKRYSFLLHYGAKPFLSGSAGALEHNTGSVYTLPSESPANAAKSLRDIASHEFFHIITPLNIHSEQIGDFDFANPTMSRHLWLYEGLTEYMASYILFRQRVKDTKEYIDNLQRYTSISRKYFKDTLPFTTMSLEVLGRTSDQYSNVYLKGPMINFCLDVRMRQLSGGAYGMPDLIKALSNKYGQERSFKDTELFDEIVAITGMPALREFFSLYVEGNKPLPLQDCFAAVGISYLAEKKTEVFSIGNVSLRPNQSGQLVIANNSEMNELGKQLGYEVGDILLELNGVPFNAETQGAVFGKWRSTAKVGDKITVLVDRNGKKMKLKGKAITVTRTETDLLTLDPNPTSEMLKLWNAWSGNLPR